MYEMAPRLMRNPGAQSQPDEFTLKLDDAVRIAPLAVEIGQRLVEQQQLRARDEPASQGDRLLLVARELMGKRSPSPSMRMKPRIQSSCSFCSAGLLPCISASQLRYRPGPLDSSTSRRKDRRTGFMTSGPTSYRIGVDVGGTFTDAVAFNAADGSLRWAKVPSTPNEPAIRVLDAVSALVADLGTVERFVHGITIVTNTIIERKGAEVWVVGSCGWGRTRCTWALITAARIEAFKSENRHIHRSTWVHLTKELSHKASEFNMLC